MIRPYYNSKSLLIAIVILLLANIALLLFFILNKPTGKKGRHEEKKAAITTFLKKEVGFDETQLHQFDSLSNLHWEKTRTMFDTIRNRKEEQLKQLASLDFTDSSINNLASLSADRQKIIETYMLQHIKEIRKLCTPLQLPIFDSLFYKVFVRKKDVVKKEAK